MGKSKPKAPAAPDPTQVAAAQTQQNKDTAIANAALNRIDQVTPWGSLTYTQSGVDANGIPKYTQNVNLSPEQQKLLQSDNQISQALADLGLSQLGNVSNTLGQQFNYSNAPGQVNSVRPSSFVDNVSYGRIQDDVDVSKVPELIGGEALDRDLQTQRDALYRQQAAFLDPQWGQDRSDLENKLISQGITQNSDAWNRAVGDFSRNKEFAYSNARNNAITGGGAEQSRLFGIGLASNQNAYGQALNNAQFHNQAQQQGFGQALANAQLNNTNQNALFGQGVTNANLQNQGRNQFINEQNYLRQQPLNELNALRSGSQVTSPQFSGVPQSLVGNTDVSGLYNNQYQSQLANYNAQQAGNNALTGGLFGLGSSLLGAGKGSIGASLLGGIGSFFSDRRLKDNIQRVGTHALGIGLYTWDYVWGEPGYGVMADEVEKVRPGAVSTHTSGYKMVNYGAL